MCKDGDETMIHEKAAGPNDAEARHIQDCDF